MVWVYIYILQRKGTHRSKESAQINWRWIENLNSKKSNYRIVLSTVPLCIWKCVYKLRPYFNIFVCVCVYSHTHQGVTGQCQMLSSIAPTILFLGTHSWGIDLTGCLDCLTSDLQEPSCPHLFSADVKNKTDLLGFRTGPGEPNSGPHDYKPCALLTEVSHHPINSFSLKCQ